MPIQEPSRGGSLTHPSYDAIHRSRRASGLASRPNAAPTSLLSSILDAVESGDIDGQEPAAEDSARSESVLLLHQSGDRATTWSMTPTRVEADDN
jgi:hypothetical protein